MKTCKFCGVMEGLPDRRGKPAHINRDGLCASCYYVLERARVRPESLSVADMRWFEEMCEENRQQRRRVDKAMRDAKAVGMTYTGPSKRFIPAAQRRVWHCAQCDISDERKRDDAYSRYCTACADYIRRNRSMPAVRKTRSDKNMPRGGRL